MQAHKWTVKIFIFEWEKISLAYETYKAIYHFTNILYWMKGRILKTVATFLHFQSLLFRFGIHICRSPVACLANMLANYLLL